MRKRNNPGVYLVVFLLYGILPARSERIWFDGTVDASNEPPGKLLSDNADYWGDVILTGVEYRYPNREPDNPPDNRPDREGRLQRTLLNGNRGRRGKVGVVGMKRGHPLEVEFDFKRECAFTEIDLVTPPLSLAIQVETRPDTNGPWMIAARLEETPDLEKELHRIRFDPPQSGRQVKLVLNKSDGAVRLREFIAWGDAVVNDENPELFTPVAEGQYPVGVAFPTLTGIAKSSVSDREAYYWVQSLQIEHREQEAVWAPVPTWGSVSHQPVMPKADTINRPLHIVMARNETEAVALALKNTLVNRPRPVKVRLTPVRSGQDEPSGAISADIGVLGIIGSRNFGNNLGPIIMSDNRPGGALLRKYLLNGAEIQDFPNLTLPPAGTAICWLTVTTDQAPAGRYHTSLAIEGGEAIPVTIQVLDVTLPNSFAFVKTYTGGRNHTSMFPFVYGDRLRNDIDYALDCGISDWTPDADIFPVVRQMTATRSMRILFDMGRLLPSPPPYVSMIWQGKWSTAEDLPEDAARQIAEHVVSVVERAEELGLNYDEWYGTTGDEPGAKNMAAIAEVCRLIKASNDKVNIYLNPCYWAGYDNGAVSGDEIVAPGLQDWYSSHIDISMPLFLLLENRPRAWEAFSAKRLVNAYYYVSGHLDRSESAQEIQKYRKMAWNSFIMGFNGWAFYSYYSPRANAWNHFDRNPPGEGLREPSDYQMVYPGPRGVIRTRHSEALREGWEDWRLLHLLKTQGREDVLQELVEQYRNGTAPSNLRAQALQAVTTQPDQ